MKKFALLVVVLAVAAPVIGAPFVLDDYRTAVMADSPIAYFRMDEEPVGGPEIIQQEWTGASPVNEYSDGDSGPATTLINSADPGNHGTYYTANSNSADGISPVAPANTVWGAAGNSPGINTFASRGFASLPYDFGVSTPTAFTLEGWVFVDWTHSKTHVLASISDTNDGNRPMLYVGVDRTDGNGTGAMRAHARLSGPNRPSLYGSQLLYDSQNPSWHHLAAVFEENSSNGDTDVTLYLNGALETGTTTLGVDFSSIADVLNRMSLMTHVGSSGPSTPYENHIDEIAIFDKALDATAISNHYNGIPEPGTLALLGIGGVLALRRRHSGACRGERPIPRS